MNIYRTKGGTYINMDHVTYVETDSEEVDAFCVQIYLVDESNVTFYKEEARAFLDYLDNRLDRVYVGYA